MEPLFKNSYHMTPELWKEYSKCVTGIHKKVILILGIAYILLGLCLLLLAKSIFGGILIVLGIVFFVLSQSIGNVFSMKYNKAVKESASKLKTVLFYPDRMECISNGEEARTFPYGQITRVKKNKMIYVIILNKTLGVVVKKDSFQLGSSDEFQTFIEKARTSKEAEMKRRTP